MSIIIAGYNLIEVIYEGATTRVYRALRESDQALVIIKTLKAEYPTIEQLTRLRHEYKILQALDIEGIVKALALESSSSGLALILSDFGGEPLTKLNTAQNWDLSVFLQIAIQLASTLAQLHQNNIIHKDIKPHNILFNAQTNQVKIIDFSISSRLLRENQTLNNPNLLVRESVAVATLGSSAFPAGVGTLAYMSPEQTGRMNRSIDYRTDFYSLGVTFYEMLTGQLPFQANDPLELVHSHIAKTPVSPHLINSEIPEVVSDIVMKLLAKTAEDRYQSAVGLQADLEACLNMLQTSGEISHFNVGELDLFSQFLIPQKLYGREQEVSLLIGAFQRVSNSPQKQGRVEMMLVSGYSGIGKSSLVNEIHKPIVVARGYFISGKFDQFQRNIPYSALISAFQALVKQLLTESEAQLAQWKEKLLVALGTNAQVIIDVVPEVELIVGKQPTAPELAPTEAQNRFNLLFQNFIRVFCSQKHPLVIFLDDLQWADSGTLKLLEVIMTDAETGYLFLIGAYRDNEVNPSHPLAIALNSLHSKGVIINHITLAPLTLDHISNLIADTLHSNIVAIKPLAELVIRKTSGNPFFVNQFLTTLYQENLLTFVPPSQDRQAFWQWDISQIEAMGITDNVVELMIRKLRKLPDSTQQVLQLAACIGNTFDLQTLSIIYKRSAAVAYHDLEPAISEGLILPFSGLKITPEDTIEPHLVSLSFKFLHDRVQQAAYALIDDSAKQVTHLQIGRLLWRSTAPEALSEKIFKIVDHLNLGIELISDLSERNEIAKLNLIAGHKAKAAMASAAATEYLQVGLGLLPASNWHSQYELTLALHNEAAEVAYLNGDFEQMERLAEVVLQQAKTQLDKVRIYELRIKTCEVQRKLLEAVKLGLQVLTILGVNLVESPTPVDIQQAIEETTANLAGKGIEDLINLSPMTDTNKLAAFQLIASLVPAAYQSAPALFILMACQQVNLSIQHGNTCLSASGFADYGVVFSGLLQDIETAYQFGQLALNILARLDACEVKSQTLFKVATFILHWKHHVRETLPLLEEAYSSGLENGDLAHTGYSASHKCQYSYWSGLELKSLEQEMASYSKAIAQINQETALKWNQIFHQVVLNLIGLAENPCALIGEAYNEEQFLQFHIKLNERTVIHYIFLNKLILCYLFGEFTQAVENATKAEQYLDGVRGWLAVPLFHFYDSLAQLAIYPSAPQSQQEHLLSRVLNNQEKMQKWADYAPMNFQHKYELVEAEKARVLGQYWQAMEYYDRAIAGAKEHGYRQEEALANELAAQFYFSLGKQKFAHIYLTEAYYGYIQWGAGAKLKDLEARYPHVFSRIPKPKNKELEVEYTINATTTNGSGAFDLGAVLKASQALSGEIVLSNLLSKLMKILLENAGAETGFLILENAGKLLIEAFGSVDKDEIIVQQSTPVETSQQLPLSIINYVRQTQENVVLNDATREEAFTTDTYILNSQPKSVLCTPLIHQSKLIGILYLENNLTTDAFTLDRLEVLKILSSQAAISIENARLYTDLEEALQNLETKVEQRTLELQENNILLQQEIRASEAAVRHRKRAEEAAEAANRAKSEFLANMSHELRTPLNGILGYTQIFKKYKNLTEQQKNGISIIHQCGEHLLTLINDILDLSKIEARKMELYLKEFHFPEFLNTVLEICRIRAEQKGLPLIYKTLSPLPRFIRADEKRLRQVLINLLSNAIKFTEKGSITFKVGYVTANGEWETRGSLWGLGAMDNGNKGDKDDKGDREEFVSTDFGKSSSLSSSSNSQFPTCKLRFQVEDTGIGIAPEQLEEIFLPFKQVGEDSQKIEGTGLGLAISRQLVQMMGGELKVKSTLGQGSVFWLDLDLPESQQVNLAPVNERNVIGFVGSKRKVLVVDDKWANRSVMVSLLAPLGFEVAEATDGLDGLMLAQEFKPDVIFMDLVMPVMDGFEATRQLRMLPELEGVVVIAISASVFNFDQQQSQDVGCDGFISKPVREAELLEKLRVYLGLEWIYEESDESKVDSSNLQPSNHQLSTVTTDNTQLAIPQLIVPPAQELAALLDLAKRGDLRGIAKRTIQLEELDPKWIPFTTHLRQLAKEFKGKRIREFLKHYSRGINEC